MHPSDIDTAVDMRARLAADLLPPTGQVLLQLIDHCHADRMDMAEVGDLIAKDVALAAKILALSAGATSNDGRSRRPASLSAALDALGMDLVRSALIKESTAQVFHRGDATPRGPGEETDLRQFWRHSLMAAVAAQMVAAKIGYPHPEEAYLAGLLHDVGRLALMSLNPGVYAPLLKAADDDHLCELERGALHIAHPQAGAALVASWELDSFLADSVLYHHEPVARLEKSHPLIRIGYLAHRLTGDEQPNLEALRPLCDLGPDALDLIRERALMKVQKEAERIGINFTGSGADAAEEGAVHRRLAEKVRDLVLSAEAGRSFARQKSQSRWLETVTQSASLLFGFDDLCLLLADARHQALVGAPVAAQHRRLAELSIALDGNDAIATAARERCATWIDQAGAELGLVEEQLLRMMACERLVCVPLVSDGRCLGVMIGAGTRPQLLSLREREAFLLAFGAQAATALASIAGQADESSRAAAALKEQYREAARKAAHEANNPLSIIKNYLSVLDRKLAKKEQVSSEISILNEEINRVGQIINRLGDLQPVSDAADADINRVVGDVIRLFRDTEFIPPDVSIAAELHDESLPLQGDGDLLKQILVNLMKNAVEALNGSGRIEIGTHGLVNRDGMLFAEISVRDSGPGIPAEAMSKLFSPMQSSKGDGHRGLGLSIVHGLVKQLQGFITCRSDRRGTHFEILLPSGADQPSAPARNARNLIQG